MNLHIKNFKSNINVCIIFTDGDIIYNRIDIRSSIYFLILKSKIVPKNLNNIKYHNNDTLDDKLTLVRQRFVTRGDDILHKTYVNRDTNDILKPTSKLLSKRSQTKNM